MDFIGFSFATHSYNSTSDDDDGYIVVIKVTDNDGLTATSYCQIPIIEETSSGSSTSKKDTGLSSNLTTTGGLLGIAILLLGTVGLVFYFNRDNFDTYSAPSVSTEPKATSESTSFNSKMSEDEKTKPTKRKVMRKRVVTSEIPEMMTVECPQCSSQIEIPKVSGSQQLKCPDCGLEGEIDI